MIIKPKNAAAIPYVVRVKEVAEQARLYVQEHIAPTDVRDNEWLMFNMFVIAYTDYDM